MTMLPKHGRPASLEWDNLLAESAQALAGDSLPPAARQAMYHCVDQLPDEPLEANRYYALGIVTCHYVQLAAAASARSDIIDRAAHLMADRSRQAAVNGKLTPGLRFTDLHAAGLETAADLLAPLVNDRLTKPVGLLADALNIVGIVRSCLAEADRFGWDTQVGGPIDNAAHIRQMYRRGEPIAARRVTQNGLAGAMSVYRRAVQARLVQDEATKDDPNPRLFDVLTADELTALQPLTVARKAAGLRIDEHASPLLDELLVGDSTGILRFRRDKLSPRPPAASIEDSPVTSTHIDRLTCPALQVDGAIQQSLQLIPEIVIRAQSLISGAEPV